MKFYLGLLASMIVLTNVSCKKNKGDDTPAVTVYGNMKAGSTWNYKEVSNNNGVADSSTYSVVCTTQDTVINNKTYRVFNNGAEREYRAIIDHDYFTMANMSAISDSLFENLYLKDNALVNFTWSQTYTLDYNGIPLSIVVTNKIAETASTRTVNGVEYKNVIKVVTTLTPPAIPGYSMATDVYAYYAPNFGMIESYSYIKVTQPGNTSTSTTTTKLVSATLN